MEDSTGQKSRKRERGKRSKSKRVERASQEKRPVKQRNVYFGE
jgi:hypothetical protein